MARAVVYRMDKRVPVSYSDPERLIVYAPSSTRPSPRPSPSPYPPSPTSSRSSASIRSYAWNPALFAVDRNKRLTPSRPILTYWRTKKRAAIGIIVLVFVAITGIVAGITAGVLERQHANRAASPLNNIPPSPNNIPSLSRHPPLSSGNTSSLPSLTHMASPQPQPSTTPVPVPTSLKEAFDKTRWIWNDSNANISASDGPLAFRRTFLAGANATAFVLLAADNECQLYHNGKNIISTASLWTNVTAVSVSLDPGPNVFAVKATNKEGTPAGLRVTAYINHGDGNPTMISSDVAWLTTHPPPDKFEMLSFNNTDAWKNATILEENGKVWMDKMDKLVIPQTFS